MASQVTNLTGFADQLLVLQLVDGTSLTLELIFQGATNRWCGIVTYAPGNFNSGLIDLCCSPNILRQWKEILPFGIAITTADQTDPFDINDFTTGRVSMWLLDQADVAEIELVVYGGPQI